MMLFRSSFWITRAYCTLCRVVSVRQSLPSCPVEMMGLHFPNPVGLAAGFDRDGRLVGCLAPTGFGFVEIGTINANSEVASDTELACVVRTLRNVGLRSHSVGNSADRQLLGISLGSMRDALDERTAADYLKGMDLLWEYADYLVINLSRPGSPGRLLQSDAAALRFLLENIKHSHDTLASRHNSRIPIIIKVAIDHQCKETIPLSVPLARDLGFDGVLAAFEHWPSRQDAIKCISDLSSLIQPLSLIVVGGIRTVDDIRQALEAGADLVQLYTGFVKQGPLQSRRMISRLTELK